MANGLSQSSWGNATETLFFPKIIHAWKPSHSQWSSTLQERVEPSQTIHFPELLCELGDIDLVRRFITEVLPKDNRLSLGHSFVTLCNEYSWKHFADNIELLLKGAEIDSVVRNVRLVHELCVAKDKAAERNRYCKRFCEAVVTAIISMDQATVPNDYQARSLQRGKIIAALVDAMMAVGATKPLKQFIEHTLSNQVLYDLTDAHFAAIFQLESLLSSQQKPRSTIVQWLRACERDLSHFTQRSGSPYTLVFTKTTASHEAACKVFERDKKNKSKVSEILNALKG